MAGHSKWAQIKRQKAVKDYKKGQTFARYAREIMVASRMGGPDPAGNFRLRTAIAHAKAAGLPNDNIARAIEKGQGAGGADALEALTYEGYGAGGVPILVEALSENRNRTAGDVRSLFSKYGGNLGAEGCVLWQFEAVGLIRLPAQGLDETQLIEAMLAAGGLDLTLDDAEPGATFYEVVTPPEALNAVCQVLSERLNVHEQSAEVTRRSQSAELTIAMNDPAQAKLLLKLLNALEALEDVQAVHANVSFDDAMLTLL
ncbi:MAG: YebC/PmpR family DNA-binding transcriptional regulator [Vampirovibrionales bacterium]|nr:YebC/PmpR family DNA-binding transcriptional regulator [Vampirovibrionales bacterium]